MEAVQTDTKHEFTPLAEIFSLTSDSTKELLDKYLMHKEHVSRHVYADVPSEKQIQQIEAALPAYKDTEDLAEDFLRNLEWPDALTPLIFRLCD